MHVFMDESGSFSGFTHGSLGVVAALAVPDTTLPKLTARYLNVRSDLPQKHGEVKGKSLNETQVSNIITLLTRYHVILEVTVIDLGAHTLEGVVAYKNNLAQLMEDRLPRFNSSAQIEVCRTIDQIRKTSVPLFLQAMASFDVLQSVIRHVPLFFAQRQPRELNNFSWVVDGKGPSKVTDWESWWSWYAHGALAVRSRTYPRPELIGADYSYFTRFDARDGEGTDLELLLADLRFSSDIEPGLELVDILVNATRRALVGNLRIEGWRNIRRLMIHRPEHYINLMLLAGAGQAPTRPVYGAVVKHFSAHGKTMLSPKFSRMAAEEEAA